MSATKERIKAARESLREFGRGLSPRYRPGTEPLVIDELISPLRYDVLVRSQFFAFLAEHRALFDADEPAFVEAVRGTDYHRWYTAVAVHAIGIAGRPNDQIEAAFAQRVRRSAALADSVAERGFIPKPPLTVRVSSGDETGTGKHLGPRHYPLDGCHRLALLRQLGRTKLEAGEYRVTTGHGSLLDNTAKLIEVLALDEARYLPFVAAGYVDRPVRDRDELLAVVRAEHPDRMAELESVLLVDGSRLR